MFECVFDDGTAHLHCRWWQAQPWMEDWYAVGREFLIFGKPDSLKPRNMDHPETELVEPGEDEFIHVNRIVPIHPLTEGLTARVMRTLVWRALEKFERNQEIAEPAIQLGFLTSFIPHARNAVRMIHFPEELTDVEIARQRLALDEFVALQFQIQSRRKKFEALAKALAVRRRQPVDETVSRANWVSSSPPRRRTCCGKSARTWAARIRCGGCCKAMSAPAKPPWPRVRR